MHTFRERWPVPATLFAILTIGDCYANHGRALELASTFILIAGAALMYNLLDNWGWLADWYVLERAAPLGDVEPKRSLLLRNALLFGLLSIFCVLYVELTGGRHSPLVCLLYVLPLLAGIRFGAILALFAAVCSAVVYLAPTVNADALGPRLAAACLSFPAAALFGSVLSTRFSARSQMIMEDVNVLGALMDASQMLETAIDLNTTVNLLLINVQKILGADVSAVYLCELQESKMLLAASSVDNSSGRFSLGVDIDDLQSGRWKVHSNEVLSLKKLAGDPNSRLCQWPEKLSADGLIAALVGSEGVLGILYVGRNASRPSFSMHDELKLRKFASHMSMPLQKAQYQENLSYMAFRDQMTNLSNFRYFEQRLAEELLRAKRYQQQLSLLLVDIDLFKKFNDEYGHKAGDALLKLFGSILKQCLRDSDLPARYGGEEFIVICPATSSDEARSIGERIRATVAEAEFNIGESLLKQATTVHITVSIGSCSYPAHAVDAGALVREADRALYAAKEGGRNRFVSCDDIPSVDETIAARTAA